MQCPKCKTDNPGESVFCAKCGTQIKEIEEKPLPTQTIEVPKEELTTGSTFADRYQIIEELGKGGMGRVYKVLDKEVKAKIALKLIKPEIASDKKTIERFRNELKTARDISHKNICRMYDLNKEEGSYYITMEYVTGEDLKSFIRRSKQLSIPTVMSIAKQICDGLSEAHKLGVIHRDLKPSNIMIDKDGNARIMDFGIARSLKGKGITGAGVMIGTPEYMAPEQVEGKETDQRSDIYSLGVILYEMVTGRVPFEGDTPFTVGVKHKSETPKDPKEHNVQIPEDLNHVILRCLEKDKNDRYQSVGEILSELSNIEKGIPTTEMKIPDKKPLTSREITVTVGVKKFLIPVLIIIAVLIIGLVLWQILPKKEAVPVTETENPSLAVMYFENNTGDERMDQYRKAISDLLITDLSQSKYLQVMSGAKLFSILDKMGKLEERTFSSETIEEVANWGKVGYVIVGSYSRAGDVYRLNYSLLDADSSNIVGSDTVEGRGQESIFAMVDEITRMIKASLNLSEVKMADDLDMNIGEITTSSPEAYKYYSEGTKYDHMGQLEKSIKLMEKAIEIDPKFAMAYRSKGITLKEMGYETRAKEGKEYTKKAFELSNRVSLRERYQIQGDYYWEREETYDKAIEAYSKLLELYPTDTDANINLGSIYRILEEWDKALERFEVLREAGDQSMWTYLNLALIAMARESFAEAEEAIQYYFNNIGEATRLHYVSARNYVLQGKLDLALAEISKVAELNPDDYSSHLRKGDIFLLQGDLSRAEQEYQMSFESKFTRVHYSGFGRLLDLNLMQGKFKKAQEHAEKRIAWDEENGEMQLKASAHLRLAYIHSLSRNYEKAIEEVDESWKTAVAADLTNYQRNYYYNRAYYLIQMGSFDEAQEAIDEYKTRIDKGMNKNRIRNYYILMGRLELEKGNFTKAIEYLEMVLPLYPYGPLYTPTFTLDILASAHFKSRDLKKAQEVYGKITELTEGRGSNGHLYVKAFYMLGKIHEELGETDKAIENYEKFLDLWKDADPGIAEVDNARERLIGLQGKDSIRD